MLISKREQKRLVSASTSKLDRKAAAVALRAAADKLEAGEAMLDDLDEEELEDEFLLLDDYDDEEHEHT